MQDFFFIGDCRIVRKNTTSHILTLFIYKTMDRYSTKVSFIFSSLFLILALTLHVGFSALSVRSRLESPMIVHFSALSDCRLCMWKPFEEEISNYFFKCHVGYLENYPTDSTGLSSREHWVEHQIYLSCIANCKDFSEILRCSYVWT